MAIVNVILLMSKTLQMRYKWSKCGIRVARSLKKISFQQSCIGAGNPFAQRASIFFPHIYCSSSVYGLDLTGRAR